MTSSTVFENESFFQVDKRHDIFGNPLLTIDPLFEYPFQFDYRYDIYGNLIPEIDSDDFDFFEPPALGSPLFGPRLFPEYSFDEPAHKPVEDYRYCQAPGETIDDFLSRDRYIEDVILAPMPPPPSTISRGIVLQTREEDMPTQEEMAAAYDTVFGDDSMIHLPYYLLPTFSFTRGAVVKYPIPPSLALCSPPELRYDPSDSSMEIDTSPLQEPANLGHAHAQVQAVSEASMPVAGHVPRPQRKLPPAHSLKHKSSPPALSLSALKQAQPRTASSVSITKRKSSRPARSIKQQPTRGPTAQARARIQMMSKQKRYAPDPDSDSLSELVESSGGDAWDASQSNIDTDIEQPKAAKCKEMDGCGHDLTQEPHVQPTINSPVSLVERGITGPFLREGNSDSECDDGADSDYVPEGPRPRRPLSRRPAKAPLPKAAPAPAPQASSSKLSQVAVPAKIIGKKRTPERAPQTSGGKRRKLADTTSSVVNKSAGSRKGKGVVRKRPQPRVLPPAPKDDPPYPLPAIKRVRHFGFLIDITTIGRQVDLSEIPADKIPRLNPRFNSFHEEEDYVPLSNEEWSALVRKLQETAFVEFQLHDKMSTEFMKRLDKVIKPNESDRVHPCPIPGCEYMTKLRKDVIKHVATHIAGECFCPKCGSIFGRFDSLTRHVTNDKYPLCGELATKYQYKYHNAIFSLYYLGLYDTFDICDVIFTRIAKRPRFDLPDAANFKRASFPLVWEGGDNDGDEE